MDVASWLRSLGLERYDRIPRKRNRRRRSVAPAKAAQPEWRATTESRYKGVIGECSVTSRVASWSATKPRKPGVGRRPRYGSTLANPASTFRVSADRNEDAPPSDRDRGTQSRGSLWHCAFRRRAPLDSIRSRFGSRSWPTNRSLAPPLFDGGAGGASGGDSLSSSNSRRCSHSFVASRRLASSGVSNLPVVRRPGSSSQYTKASACLLWSRTMKHGAVSSTVHCGGKRGAVIAPAQYERACRLDTRWNARVESGALAGALASVADKAHHDSAAHMTAHRRRARRSDRSPRPLCSRTGDADFDSLREIFRQRRVARVSRRPPGYDGVTWRRVAAVCVNCC
jgi:hypothetical protein